MKLFLIVACLTAMVACDLCSYDHERVQYEENDNDYFDALYANVLVGKLTFSLNTLCR